MSSQTIFKYDLDKLRAERNEAIRLLALKQDRIEELQETVAQMTLELKESKCHSTGNDITTNGKRELLKTKLTSESDDASDTSTSKTMPTKCVIA